MQTKTDRASRWTSIDCERNGASRRFWTPPVLDATGSGRHRRLAPCRSLIETRRFLLDNALEGPDPGGERDGDDAHRQIQGDADPHVVTEAITAGTVNHQIRLVADRRRKTG